MLFKNFERGGSFMKVNHSELVEQCRKKLLQEREDSLNQCRRLKEQMSEQPERGGDEADQSLRAQAERDNLQANDRLLYKIREIDLALHRVESGSYGYCEVTEEPIEPERLLAIPWTRLSIEGAELREEEQKRKKSVR